MAESDDETLSPDGDDEPVEEPTEVPEDESKPSVGASDPDELVIPPDLIEKAGGEENVRKIAAMAMRAEFSGPLPPPRLLAQYGEILPDAPDRIIKMAELQQEHRMYIEKTVIDQGERRANLGLYGGFAALLILVIGSIYLIATGKEIYGLVLLLGTGIAGLGNFIRILRDREAQLEERSGVSAEE